MEGKFYSCVACGKKLEDLYIQYSPGNIRLMKCEKCKVVADEYIECEFMIPLIDLFIHNPKAYRHVLYNHLPHQFPHPKILLWKMSFAFLLLDAIRSFCWRSKESSSGSSLNFSSTVLLFRKVVLDVIIGNITFVSILLLGAMCFMRSTISKCRDMFVAILISSYFKIFYVAMMLYKVRNIGEI